ncbi:MAG TPA: DUF1761 domain-containing protein [Steroidobacteraceae bacterium]|nr:DUF1761 domain-containing protein [Steroidobacteraceae bacterium]
MADINWLAVLAAALSAFLLGGLWYSPALFQKAWQRGAQISDEELQKGGHPGKTYGGAFVLSLVAAATFAMFLGKPPVGEATAYGFCVGLTWVAASFGINYLFERKTMTLFLVNGGYHTLQFTLYGLILGLWH